MTCLFVELQYEYFRLCFALPCLPCLALLTFLAEKTGSSTAFEGLSSAFLARLPCLAIIGHRPRLLNQPISPLGVPCTATSRSPLCPAS